MKRARLILLRRDPESLSEYEKKMLLDAFPEGYELVRTDPQDFLDHLDDCRRIEPQAVILPGQRPIPIAAMQEGFTHIVFSPQGLSEVVEIPSPIFQAFPR